jgi:2-polyprenyl-3-methyl-5-hydroxy-6-metoxy-1,4-benzoquinol methylase
MDDLSLSGPILTRTLDDLGKVHRILGGGSVVIHALHHVFKQNSEMNQVTHILDAGCGGGDSMRSIARWARKQKMTVSISGIDANNAAIEYAREKSTNYPEITYSTANLFDDALPWSQYDIVIFSLILHHFKADEILGLFNKCHEAGVPTIIVNDLHRSGLAYFLFHGFTRLFKFSKMARADGLLSIKKGFRRDELKSLIDSSCYALGWVRWKWAFRYIAVMTNK